jgi:HlyD family secretion protein
VEFDETRVGFDLAGRVRGIAVAEGDHIAASSLIAELDDELDRSAREEQARRADTAKTQIAVVRAGSRPEEIAAMAARVRSAKATEDLLSKNLAREKTLLSQGVVAQAGVDDLDAQLARAIADRQSLEQNLALLQRGARAVDVQAAESNAVAAQAGVSLNDVRLAHHELRSPRAGTVLDVVVDPGEVVLAGAPVVVLADTMHPYCDIFVPQAKMAGIVVGTAAHLRIDALSQSFAGRVEHVARQTEFTPRYLFSERERPNLVVRVRVRLEDPKEHLFAGVPAEVTLDGV